MGERQAYSYPDLEFGESVHDLCTSACMTCAPVNCKYLTFTITRARERKKKKKVEKEQQKKDSKDKFPSEAFKITIFRNETAACFFLFLTNF